jgi:hypothetical protein
VSSAARLAEWREDDGVVVLRPRVSWEVIDPLDTPVDALKLQDINAGRAMQVLAAMDLSIAIPPSAVDYRWTKEKTKRRPAMPPIGPWFDPSLEITAEVVKQNGCEVIHSSLTLPSINVIQQN